MVNPLFTNGVIAVKERLLLGEKLLRFTELSVEEVLRACKESGFGGVEAEDGEELVEGEERVLDDFIREYAPTQAEKVYLLAPRDFHNAKALCKAKLLGASAEKLLAPEGLIPVEVISAAIESGEYAGLGKELGGAVQAALETEELTGAQVGALFDIALYRHLSAVCRFHPRLKKLLAGRADRTNILTAVRASGDRDLAETLYVSGGKLAAKDLSGIFDENAERAEHALDKKPCADFYKLCLSAREKAPLTEAERALESYEAEYFQARRYELEGKEPFLYYVFRRRAEIQNVRIILVCLNAGLSAQDIKKRLRAI